MPTDENKTPETPDLITVCDCTDWEPKVPAGDAATTDAEQQAKQHLIFQVNCAFGDTLRIGE